VVILYENSLSPIQGWRDPVLEPFYSQLNWLYDNFEIVQAFYDGYREICGFI